MHFTGAFDSLSGWYNVWFISSNLYIFGITFVIYPIKYILFYYSIKNIQQYSRSQTLSDNSHLLQNAINLTDKRRVNVQMTHIHRAYKTSFQSPPFTWPTIELFGLLHTILEQNNCKEIDSLVSEFKPMWKVFSIKLHKWHLVPWVVIVQNKFQMNFNKPTGCSIIADFTWIDWYNCQTKSLQNSAFSNNCKHKWQWKSFKLLSNGRV